MSFIQKNKLWIYPLVFMAIIAPFTPYLDLKASSFFYERGNNEDHFISSNFIQFVYVWGLVPGQALATFSAICLTLSYFVPALKKARPHALYLLLTFAIGSGLISSAILKDHWGRPRPRQIVEFGGKQEYRPFYKPDFSLKNGPTKSFPSGHATVGFYFFALTMMGRRFKKRWLAISGTIFAICLGSLLGIVRIAQGGHFFSDVLMAALIMWEVAILFDWLVYDELNNDRTY